MTSPREVLQTFAAAVVTGGSSGIGKSFIELAAKMHPGLRFCNLSRSAPVIKDSQLMLCHIACDLAREADVERGAAEVEDFLNRDVPAGRVLLINNSGFGAYGAFPEPNLTQHLEMLRVNVLALVNLTGRLLPVLKARGGAVINVASTAAFQPMPRMATYAAAKSFVLEWTVALNEEWRGTNLRAIALCPGPTATQFFRRAGLAPGSAAERTGMSAEAVAGAAIRALAGQRSVVVPGIRNRLLSLASRFGRRQDAARISAMIVRRFRR